MIVSQNGCAIELAPPFVTDREEMMVGMATFARAIGEVCG
jgi:hypothetical protein